MASIGRPLTRAQLLQHLDVTIGVEGEYAKRLLVSNVLQWTADIFEFAYAPVRTTGTINLSGATTTYTAFVSVPAGEMWLLESLGIDSTSGNSMMEMRPGGTGSRNQSLPLERIPAASEGTNKRNAQLWQPIIALPSGVFALTQSDSFGSANTGNVGDTAVRMWIAYRRINIGG